MRAFFKVTVIAMLAVLLTADNFSGSTHARRVYLPQQPTASSCPVPNFPAITNLNVGMLPDGIAAADFNGDGKIDLAVANFGANSVSVFLNNGSGQFGASVDYAVGTNPTSILAADFNADGKIDLAVTNGGSDNVLILLGDGKGGFRSNGVFFVGADPNAMVAGDFNGDGKLDLAVVNDDTDDLTILLGNGNGTFRSLPNIPVGATPLAIVAGDFNGDGKLDLAVVNYFDDDVAILLGNGAGGFIESSTLATGTSPSAIVAGDFNGDGKIDLAVTDAGPDDVAVFLGNGNGGFTNAVFFDVGITPFAIAKGDFNGDGKSDLVVANEGSNDISLLLGDGAGGFQTATTLSVGLTPSALAPADLNGDGRLDLAVPNSDSNNVSILISACGLSNPIDTPEFFVRQQYVDFLNRDADSAGLAFWTNQITSCGADSACIEIKRINVSAAFYLSIEFQQTGYLVYKTYGAAFGLTRIGNTAPLTFAEFLADVQQIGSGVVVGATGWDAQLEANKVTYFNAFVTRSAFTNAYPTTMPYAQFVDALNANAGLPLTTTVRNQLVNDLSAGTKTRAQALRAVAEDAAFNSAQFNKAFVLMQYFGYLRRNPYDPPEATRDFAGYNFWLNKLNFFNGNYIQAEMVKAFITSTEYRQRFGS